MNREEAVAQMRATLAPRTIADEFDRGWAAAIERAVEFLTADMAGDDNPDYQEEWAL